MFADTVASFSRKLAATPLHKGAEVLRRYYPAKHGITVIRDFDGDLRFEIDRSSYIDSAIYWRGAHSAIIRQTLSSLLKPQCVFLDIGANIGEMTVFAAKRSAKVLAFEPLPHIFVQLSRNVELNGFQNVELFNAALSDKPGRVSIGSNPQIFYGTTNHGQGSVLCSNGAVTVPAQRLDDIFTEQRLDLIKIDVEGAENLVLKGAEACIRKFLPVIIMEIGKDAEPIRFLRALGYSVAALGDHDVACTPS